MTLAWLKMFVITIQLRSRTFFNLNRTPKHWFFSKFAIFCNIFWLETRTMEKTRSCFVRFRLEMTWIDCHNFHLRNRTSVYLKRVLRYWQRHQHTDFFFKICNFLQYFLLGNMQHGKNTQLICQISSYTWPGLLR